MGRLDALVDRFFADVVARWSGRSALIATLVCFPGLALILPVVLGWSQNWLAVVNLWGAL